MTRDLPGSADLIGRHVVLTLGFTHPLVNTLRVCILGRDGDNFITTNPDGWAGWEEVRLRIPCSFITDIQVQ